jgi:hypothetical protein
VADDWIKILVGPTKAALADIDRRADRATMYGLRAVGRRVKQEARRRAPVYKGTRSSMSLKDVKAARKAGRIASHDRIGRTVRAANLAEGNKVVPGLLKDSISSSKRLRREGDGYRLGIAPRGPRVHLYSQKMEQRSPYMRPGWEAAQSEMEAIFMRTWTKATQPK